MTSLLLDGPFTTRDAERARVDHRTLSDLCAAGELVRPHQGVYLPAHLVDELDARAAACALVLPPGGALARESAAWLQDIDVRPPNRWQHPPALECVVPLGATRPDHPGVNAFISTVTPDDIHRVNGVPCTAPTRTALDLARFRPRFIGLGAVDAFAHAGLTTVRELRDRLETLRGHRFIRRAREVVALCDPRTESFGESWCRLRLHEAELAPTDVQISLRDAQGREVYRLDMGYVAERVGGDYDGIEHHLRTPEQQARDAAREADIYRGFGWKLLRASSPDILGRYPRLEAAVMELLGRSHEVRRRSWDD